MKLDHTEAAKWYRKAAGQGVADAQHNLGIMYGKGVGVSQNFAEAVRWFQLAAEQVVEGALQKLYDVQQYIASSQHHHQAPPSRQQPC